MMRHCTLYIEPTRL